MKIDRADTPVIVVIAIATGIDKVNKPNPNVNVPIIIDAAAQIATMTNKILRMIFLDTDFVCTDFLLICLFHLNCWFIW